MTDRADIEALADELRDISNNTKVLHYKIISLRLDNVAKALRTASPAADRDVTGLPLGPDLIEKIVEEAMLDTWNDICSDTGCHPFDIKRTGRALEFQPAHWSSATAKRVSSRICDELSYADLRASGGIFPTPGAVTEPIPEPIIDRYDAICVEKTPIAACLPNPGTGWAHLRWMLIQLRGDVTGNKAHRWLGFIQGVMAERGIISVQEERDFTRPFFTHPAPASDGAREALEPFLKAARIIEKRPQDYGEKRIAAFGGLADAHDIYPRHFMRLLSAVQSPATEKKEG